MPRARRLTPMAMPTGTPTATASAKAEKTRNMLQAKWPRRVLLSSSPAIAWSRARITDSGFGRNSGLIQPRFFATHHRAISAATVRRLKTRLDPPPSSRYRLTFTPFAIGSPSRARQRAGFPAPDEGQNLLAGADELRVGFDRARLLARHVPAGGGQDVSPPRLA